VGEKVVRQHATEAATQTATPPNGPVVIGLDGGYVRSRHRQEERHFEVIAGKVVDAAGTQHRFAFTRNGQAASADAFAQALAAAGVYADTPATVLCDGDAGLWRLQREALPAATVALDWWHIAIRFEHGLQTARGLGAADADLADEAVRNLERAKWRLWHGRWTGCRRKLAGLYRWTKRKRVREIAGVDRLQRHICDLLGYLERNQDMLGALCRPALTWRTDLDGVRRERGQRDRGQTHEQETTDALEQDDRAALPRRTHRRAERHA